MAKIRLAADVQIESFVDGKGLRMVVWFQGCKFNCEGCHNKHTQSFTGGKLVDISEVIAEINKYPYHDGVTISGGDPFEQREQLLELVKRIKDETEFNIWVYTGYLYEDLLKECSKILEYIDVLVDGLFVLKLRTLSKKFVGSSNQRVIDVAKSFKDSKVKEYYS